jgi:hypothetical protein
MNLLGVNCLNLHTRGSRILPSGLGAQGLQLRRLYRGARVLLQHLLFSGKRNRTRRWSEFGNYRTIRKSGRRRGGFAAIAVGDDALTLRRYFGGGSYYLCLTHLVGVDVNRGALNGLRRYERILRHRHDGSAIYVIDVGDIDIGHIDVRNAGIGDVHLADVTFRHMVRGVVYFARAEGKPAHQTAAPAANRHSGAESAATDESHQRGSIVYTRRNRAGAPGPTIVD